MEHMESGGREWCWRAMVEERCELLRGMPLAWSFDYADERPSRPGPRPRTATKSLLTLLLQARGERSYDIFSRLLRERVIFLGGPVSLEGAREHSRSETRRENMRREG